MDPDLLWTIYVFRGLFSSSAWFKTQMIDIDMQFDMHPLFLFKLERMPMCYSPCSWLFSDVRLITGIASSCLARTSSRIWWPEVLANGALFRLAVMHLV